MGSQDWVDDCWPYCPGYFVYAWKIFPNKKLKKKKAPYLLRISYTDTQNCPLQYFSPGNLTIDFSLVHTSVDTLNF